MVGFDYQSVLIGTYFEKKGFSIVYADFYFQHLKSQDQRERENRNTSVHAETRSCPPLY